VRWFWAAGGPHVTMCVLAPGGRNKLCVCGRLTDVWAQCAQRPYMSVLVSSRTGPDFVTSTDKWDQSL
jgi:hypothetical protein